MRSSDEMLEQAARDGSMDISEWPRVLDHVLQRLHDIVHNGFPMPVAPPPEAPLAIPPPVVIAANHIPPPTSKSPEPAEQPTGTVASPGKENTAPRPPVPSFTLANPARQQSPSSPLPPDLYALYNSSRTTLETSFPTAPPYTIQRLAELVLQPKRYYRHLPAFLSALDRVVSVTSPLNAFPLAQANIDAASGFLANGDPVDSLTERESLGSDESLGGALLTPIPWLKRENGHHDFRSESSQTIEGPNGAGLIETVSVSSNGISPGSGGGEEEVLSHEQTLRAEGGVTQGELLRQEQEAGIVPVGQEVPRRALMAGGSGSASAVGRDASTLAQEENSGEKPEDHAHARGPEEIGAEDMGPQDTAIGVTRPLNMEAAAGRAKSPEVSRNSKDPEGDEGMGVETVSGEATAEKTIEPEQEETKKKEQPKEKADETMTGV